MHVAIHCLAVDVPDTSASSFSLCECEYTYSTCSDWSAVSVFLAGKVPLKEPRTPLQPLVTELKGKWG